MKTFKRILIITGIILVIGGLALRLPELLKAYPARPGARFNHVGCYWVFQGRLRQGSGIFRFAANEEGLRITPLLPPWWRSIVVPWTDIWIGGLENEGYIDARTRLEFARLPGTQFELRASFIVRLHNAMDGNIPL